MGNPFDEAITSESQLRTLYEMPSGLAARKEIHRLDEMSRRFIECASVVFLATADQDGRCDVSPRGGPPGFVTVLDEHHLLIPDATGNKWLDAYRNVIATGRAGLVFVIPGRGQTLRVNGTARVTARPDLLALTTAVGKPPRAALVVAAEEVFTHCPKAFVRSGMWQPDRWPAADEQPSSGEVLLAHVGDPELTLAEVEQSQRDSLLHRLD